jgi:hypothetical protein
MSHRQNKTSAQPQVTRLCCAVTLLNKASCANCSQAAATRDLDPVLRHLLVKRLLLLRIVQRVAEAVAAAGSHPDAQADAGGVLLDERAHALHRAGGEGQRRPCRDEPTFDRPAWPKAVVFNPNKYGVGPKRPTFFVRRLFQNLINFPILKFISLTSLFYSI